MTIRPATASRDVWRNIERVEPTARLMTGVLKMVDIEQARFRLRDDVRNSIALHHVAEPERAAGRGRAAGDSDRRTDLLHGG
ncbi:MAG: hypothetical protein WKF47_13915 [Geodermatophilaceae bacterium]